jgi:hypothetical protein
MLKNSLFIPIHLSLALLVSTFCLSGTNTLANESKLLTETLLKPLNPI